MLAALAGPAIASGGDHAAWTQTQNGLCIDMKRFTAAVAAILLVGVGSAACAQTVVTLPDTSQTTTLTATVSAQARVTLPAGVTFNVTDIGSTTAASAASVTIDQIAMAAATNQLKISLEANAASFTPPVGGATTWAAGDVTWNAATWTNGTGSTGTLSNPADTTV